MSSRELQINMQFTAFTV